MDLRPHHSPVAFIEGVTAKTVCVVGEVNVSGAAADDAAADSAVASVVHEGWYARRRQAAFEIEFYWDNVHQMASFMETSYRMRRVTPSYSDMEKAHRDLGARYGGRVRFRYRRPMKLAVYDKLSLSLSAQGALVEQRTA